MDILCINIGEHAQIRPLSVHGILWLQTHFEHAHWEAIASGQVKLSIENVELLINDATEAGLSLTNIPSMSIPGKI